MQPSLKAIVWALQDSLMLLAPRRWVKVKLTVSPTPMGLRLTELASEGNGAKEPTPKAPFDFHPELEALRLSEALSDLVSALDGRWKVGTVQVERPNADFVDWKLLHPDGTVAWFTRLGRDELGSLLMTDALFDALEGSHPGFLHLQEQLERQLGQVTGFAFDAAAGVLRLEEGASAFEVPAQLIGTYLTDTYTWVWGWSEEEAASAGTSRVRRFCQPELKAEGLAALWRPHFYQDEAFAWALASHVAVGIGARGLFRGQPPGAGGVLLLAPIDFPSRA